MPLLGDHLGTDALADQATVITINHAGTKGAITTGGIGKHRHTRHRFDATGDDEVILPSDHTGGAEVRGLLARPALPIDCHPGYVLGEASGERCVPPDIEPLFANLGDRAPDHIVNDHRIDAGTRDEALEHQGREVNGVNTVQHALFRLTDPDRAAHCTDDYCVAVHHVSLFC